MREFFFSGDPSSSANSCSIIGSTAQSTAEMGL